MTMSTNQIGIVLTADGRLVQSELDRTGKSLQRFGEQAGQASAQVDRGMARARDSISSLASGAAKLLLVTQGIQSISAALSALPRAAFDYSKNLETSAVGMAGIIGSVAALNGAQIEFNQALGISQGMIRQLNDDALRTAASSQELVGAFQALLAPGLAAGMKLDEIRQLTVVGTNAVRSMGLTSNQVVQELRDLVAGGITASSSTLATSLGLKDADIAKAKASSEGLFNFLMERLRGFEASSAAFGNTLEGRLSTLKEGATRVAADGMAPLTQAISTAAGQMSDLLVTFDKAGRAQLNPGLVEGLRGVAESMVGIMTTGQAAASALWANREAVSTLAAAYAALKIGQWASEAQVAVAAKLDLVRASQLAAVQAAAESAANQAAGMTAREKIAALLSELQAKANLMQSNAALAATEVSRLSATQEGIVSARAQSAAALEVTRSTIAQAEAQLSAARAAGAQSFALALVREATDTLTAAQARHAALIGDLAMLGRQQASVQANVASALAAQTAASNAASEAAMRLSAATSAASVSGRAMGAVMGALGGPVGIAVMAISGLVMWLGHAAGKASDAEQALVKYQRAMAAARDGKLVDVGDLSTMRASLQTLKDERDALLADKANPGVLAFLFGDDYQSGLDSKLSGVNGKIQQHVDDIQRVEQATQAAGASTAGMTLTLAGAEQAWKKANDGLKTASSIQSDYQEKLSASRRSFEDYIKLARDKGMSEEFIRKRQAEQGQAESALLKQRDDALKGLDGARTQAAQTAEKEIAALRSKIDAEKAYQAALEQHGPLADKLTAGEKEAIQLRREAAIPSLDAKTRAHLLSKAAIADELGALQKSNAAITEIYSRTDTIKGRANAIEAENAVWGKSKTAIEEATLAEMRNQLAKERASGASALRIKALEDEVSQQQRLVSGLQMADYKKLDQQAEELLRAAREQNSLYQDELVLAGLTALERDKIVARRQVEIKYAKELAAIDRSELSEVDKEALREKVRAAERIESAAAVNKVIFADWSKTSDQISQSLTDALMRGFESGKDFAKNLRDTVVNMFSTLVLRPVIQAVINPVAATLTGALGLPGAASAGQAGQGANPMSLASSASSAYNLLTTGVRDSISKGFTKLASSDLGQQLGLYDADAGVRSLTSSGQAVNSALQSAGGSMMAYGLSKGLSGGYQVGNGKIMDAATLVAGWFDPTGGLIAGAVSGAINRAFGRKLADSGLQGTFGGNEGFSGNSYQFYKGGWFRSDKTKTSALDPEVEAGLAGQFRALQASTGLMASTLGLGTEAISSFTSSIQLSFQGLNEEQIQARLAEEFAKVGESLASTALGTERYTRAGETAVQTMERLSSSLSTVNGTFDVLGRTLYAASLSGADMASQLVDQMGGLAQYQSTTTAYYQAYYTEAERNATATRQLTASLAALGLSLPTTRAAYRALVEAQDLTTDAGRRTYAALLGLSAQFDSLTPKLDTLAGKFGSLVAGLSDEATRLIDSQIQLSQGAARTAREASDAYRAAMTDLRSAAESILLQRVGGLQSARAAYQAQLTRAQGGDVKAMQALPSLADALIAEAKNSSRTAVEFAVASAQVASQLDGVAAVADVLGVGADYQAKLYDVNTSLLEVTREQLASGNLTVDLLQQIQTALGRVDGSIQASAQLTVGTMRTGNGGIVGALVDNAGTVVSSLDSTTVLQLAGMQGQTAAADKQAVSLGGLSKDQITKLQALGETQSKALGLTDLVAAATDGSETLLGAVLNRLSKQDSGTTDIVSALNRGNVDVLGKLAGIEAAIRQQSSDQAAELQRQQSLANAQASLEQYAGIQRATVDSVKQGIEALWSLASANGVDLLNDKGAKAYIYVSEDGLLGSNYQQTSTTSGDGYANYIREFYQSGGVYDQVYGKIGQLQSIAEDVKAARDLVVSLGGVPAYSVGGYTGPGAIDEPAGIVHKGEVVWSQDDVARAGGVQAVESLRLGGLPGFADGGAVGLPALPIAAALSDDGEVRALLRELVQQNRDLVQQNRELTRQMADLSSQVDRMRSENNIGNAQIVGETKSQSRILKTWEQVGMPAAAA
ncbi:MAG: hypothetical protein A2486_16035 [Burkholderiales bacterium RIFOXYC12_FULL_65_23]|nr:MAG: hypothetical protein A2486_16035 [Burkholderiales bacterium RIFOXYC12_FULL_65_23]